MNVSLMCLGLVAVVGCSMAGEPAGTAPWRALSDGQFAWRATPPLVAPDPRSPDKQVSVKDPTIVRHDGRWHLFCTVRFASGRVDTGYKSFSEWDQAAAAPLHLLKLHDQYYCAPQVFFFRPHKKWYLIFQMASKGHQPPFGPAFATTTTLGDAASWSKPAYLYPTGSPKRRWLDFWVICDAEKAHLFYTSLKGRMWRAETPLAKFPHGWSEPKLALRGDIFEASHTYRLKGMDKYLTIVEAQGSRRRYYKAYLADRLDGPWKGLADRRDKPFAAHANVQQDAEWTTNISHGELLRAGVDERLEVDPFNLRFLFQGATDAEYRGNPYGKIPWRLGLLERARGE
ncbi:hypothetical protein HQ576_11135 [bacterium]|nr:hypothetical protein [bacterium]